MNLDMARELLRYNTWANTRTLDVVARLDSSQFTRALGGSYSSVQGTLTHIVWAEWVWLERWHGRSPKQMFATQDFPSVTDQAGGVRSRQGKRLSWRRSRQATAAGAALHEPEGGSLGVSLVATALPRLQSLHVPSRSGDEHASPPGRSAGDNGLPGLLGRGRVAGYGVAWMTAPACAWMSPEPGRPPIESGWDHGRAWLQRMVPAESMGTVR
jgi:hypothetical protein